MFLTAEELRDLTSFAEIIDLSEGKLKNYMERADGWIRRATNIDYSDTEDSATQSDLRVATLLLVEYLWYWDDPGTKLEVMDGLQSETIGSYSWNKATPGEPTGNQELDSILTALAFKPSGVNVFRTSGKYRKNETF